MATLNLIAGDLLVDANGCHVCDSSGFAIEATEPTSVEIPNATNFDRISPLIEQARIARGLNADGTIPEPPAPEPEPEPEPE